MLHPFDDYPIHQTPEPLGNPATGDRNFYDRFFFNGYTADGELFFALAMGWYPNRRIFDASFSAVRGGRQLSIHASRQADRLERLRVGPIEVQILEPMKRFRVRVDSNPHGLEADGVFTARTVALEEPHFVHRVLGRLTMDSTRLSQFGQWEGEVRFDGERIELEPRRFLGMRDRSWGVRSVGAQEAGPPGPPPQFFWLWAPTHFDDICVHFSLNEDADGRRWHENGMIAPVLTDPKASGLDPGLESVERMVRVEHRVRWAKGTRRAEAAEIELFAPGGERHLLELQPILTFPMVGLGYFHPEWGHGMWKGPEAVAGESWKLDELNPMDPRFLHVEQLCRARMGERRGVAIFEQLVIGPHRPSGFEDLLDPAK